MSLDQIIMSITAILSFAGVVVPIVFRQKKTQDIFMEEIKEITKPDGSKVKKRKRRYK